MTTTTNLIRKSTVLRAPLKRVWEAVSNAEQFGTWFGARFDGPFSPGARVSARIVPTTVDPDVAKLQEPVNGVPFVVFVERVEAMRLLSFRWHPEGVAQDDASNTTLVEFEFAEVPEGTRLTITESGFENIPLELRARALASNEEGWTHQLMLIDKYLARPA